jgi:hypothetical protein
MVPHLLMFEGVSICHLRDSANSNQWHSVRIHDHLAPAGISVAQLLMWYAESVAEHDRDGALRAVISEPLLVQLWLTLLGYGIALAPLVSDLHAALATPLARAGPPWRRAR